MQRKYAPTAEESAKMVKKAKKNAIPCRICGIVLPVYYQTEKRRRRYFDDCSQHTILESIEFIFN